MGRIKTAIAVFFIFSASAAFAAEPEKWWNAEWEYRAFIKASSADGIGTELAHVKLPLPLKTAAGGADIRVISSGEVVPRAVLWAGPGEMAEVVFKFPKNADTCHIYFGNPGAGDPGDKVDASDLLILETWERPRGSSNSWAEFKKLLDGKKTMCGRGLRPKIWDGFNPYGSSKNYLSVYRGKVICAEDGEYSFATASDDSSFLFVDGKLIAQWPGAHGAGEGAWGQYNGKVKLDKGVHKIEYYQESEVGGQCSVAGWTPPSAKQVRLITDTDFVRPRTTEIIAFERRGKKTAAAFTYNKIASLDIEGEQLFLYRMKPWNMPKEGVEFRWEFGDGTSSAEAEPEHVFAGEERFEVTLAVKTPDGGDSVTRIADTRLLFLDTEDAGPRRFIAVALNYRIEDMPAGICRRLVPLFEFADFSEHVIRCYRAVLGKDKSLSENMRNEINLKLAAALMEEGAEEEAAGIYRALADGGKDRFVSAPAKLGLARTVLYSNPAEARKIAGGVVAECASVFRRAAREAEILIGDSWRVEGDAKKALDAYRRSADYVTVKDDPSEKAIKSGSWAQTVEHYLHLKEYNWALKAVQMWEDESPEERLEGYSLILKARARFFMKKYDLALREMETFVKTNPTGNRAPAAKLLIAEIWVNKGDFDKAKAALEKMIADYPEAAERKRAGELLEYCKSKAQKTGGKF